MYNGQLNSRDLGGKRMTKKIIVNYNEKPCYAIALEKDFQKLNEELSKVFDLTNKRVCIVSDSNVYPLYGDEVTSILQPLAKEVINFVFEAGEGSKNLDTVSDLYEKLILSKFDRNDILIALGGGVVGDLTGFAASTYLRGIDFVQVSTTLLSQVDSSIGGKTGVDFRAYKNMVGAFYQPKLVYMNISTLSTLTDRQFNCGLGEIIKHGIIKNYDYFNYLNENISQIKNRDIDVLIDMIYESCLIKKNVVENDPKEKGERALLNFGHTIGHAVEKLMNFELFHGECVAIGIIAAAYISYKYEKITKDELNTIIETIRSYDFPLDISKLDTNEIIAVTKNDKKMISGKIKFILIDRIGNAYIDTTITDDDMAQAIEYIKNKEWC